MHEYCIFIFCFGRPDFAKENTWNMLDFNNVRAPRYIVCSDDDKPENIARYKELFGDDHVIVFNKTELERSVKLDLCDCYYNKERRAIVWARNVQFQLARKLGYRYFMAFDDDYTVIRVRAEIVDKRDNTNKLCSLIRLRGEEYNEWVELQFQLLDSSPWLYTVGMSQGGDYIGGLSSKLWDSKVRFKAMNVFWGDTEKEFRYPGRINEDVNSYVTNGSRGMLSATMAGIQFDQAPTQSVSGGMTELYQSLGTYLKSIYSVVVNPAAVKINTINGNRLHHNVEWQHAVPKVVSEDWASGKAMNEWIDRFHPGEMEHVTERKPLDYATEVMKLETNLDSNGDVVIKKKRSLLENIELPDIDPRRCTDGAESWF